MVLLGLSFFWWWFLRLVGFVSLSDYFFCGGFYCGFLLLFYYVCWIRWFCVCFFLFLVGLVLLWRCAVCLFDVWVGLLFMVFDWNLMFLCIGFSCSFMRVCGLCSLIVFVMLRVVVGILLCWCLGLFFVVCWLGFMFCLVCALFVLGYWFVGVSLCVCCVLLFASVKIAVLCLVFGVLSGSFFVFEWCWLGALFCVIVFMNGCCLYIWGAFSLGFERFGFFVIAIVFGAGFGDG